MPWFKIDDKFHMHPKVVAAGNAAVGLFVRCGSYCSDLTTDGFIPTNVANLYGKPSEIARLLEVKLWAKTKGGYRVPDYLEYNPSAEKVKADRAAATERQRAARERAAANRNGHADVTDESQCDGGVSHGTVTVPPTRPDPTPSTPLHDLTTTDDYRLSDEQMSSVEVALRIAARAQYDWKPEKCHTDVDGFIDGIFKNMKAEKGLLARRLTVEGNDPITTAQKILPSKVGKTRCRIAARTLGFITEQAS